MAITSYSPVPLTKEEVQAEFDYFNDIIRHPETNLPIIDPNNGKPVVAGMRALWETGASYIDSYHLNAELAAFLHPHQAAETWGTRGLKFAYASSLPTIGALLGLGNGIAGTIGATGVGAGLLLSEKLRNQLRELEWQYETWKNAPEQALNYPILLGQQYIRQAGMSLLGTITAPLSQGLGISKVTAVPDFRFQFSNTPVYEAKRVNRITNGWRNFWSDSIFQDLANKLMDSGHINLAYGFNKAARKLKEGSHKTNPLALIFSSLIGTALTEALLMWLEKSVVGSKIAAILSGAAFPAMKAIVSFPTAATAYMGYQLFKNAPSIPIPFTPFALPLGALMGAFPGVYYQTLLNWAHNTEPIRRNIFLGSPELRRDFMPRWMDVNNSAHISEYLENYTRSVPGSSYLQEPSPLDTRFAEFRGTDELIAIKANRFPVDGLLGKLIGQPAQFLFKSVPGRFLRLPFRGFLINSLLGIPMGFGPGTATGNLILAGDYLLQVANEFPLVKQISRGGVWGAAIGAEAAYIAGAPISTGMIIGGSVGLLSSSLASLADLRTPFRSIQTAGPYAAVYDVRVEGSSYNVWNTSNPIRILRQQYPALEKLFSQQLDTLERFPKFFQSLYNLRYLKGGAIGALLGVQVSLLTGLPLVVTIPVGAGIGAGTQFIYEKLLAERLANASYGFGRALHFFGRNIVSPITGFLSGTDIVNSISSMLQHGITTQTAVQLGFGVIGAASTILVFGVSNPIGWIIVGSGIVAEVVAQVFFHTSFFGWIWSKISPLFSGVATSFGQIAGHLIGALIGLVGAVFSQSQEEMVQYVVITAVSVSAMGTLLLQVITASGFFSDVSAEARRRAAGSLYFKTEKKLDSLITNPAGQVTGAKYTFTYSYIKPFLDSNNKPIDTPLEDIKIVDTYTAPETLTPADLTPPPNMNYQREITVENLPSLKPGESNSTTLTVNFSQPLDRLLAQHQTTALCDQATLYGTLKGAPPNPIVSSNTICLNTQGQTGITPIALISSNLANFLNQCYVQTCGVQKDYVTKKDFISLNGQTCPNLQEVLACKLQYQGVYNISDSALQEIQSSATSQRGWLDSLGFVKAVADQQGQTFDYQAGCANNYKQVAPNFAKSGDILVLHNQDFGIITNIESVTNQPFFTYTSVNSTTMQGYVFTNGSAYPSDVNQILTYDPTYKCP